MWAAGHPCKHWEFTIRGEVYLYFSAGVFLSVQRCWMTVSTFRGEQWRTVFSGQTQRLLHTVQAPRCCIILNETKRKNVYYLCYTVWQLLVLVELTLGLLFWSFDFFKRLELHYMPVRIQTEWQRLKLFTDLCPSFGNALGCVLVHWFSSTQSLWENYCPGTSITALPHESNLANLGLFLISISIFSGGTDHCEVRCHRPNILIKFNTKSGKMLHKDPISCLVPMQYVRQLWISFS